MSDRITYENKVAVQPPGIRINQVQDVDMNEIKTVVNKHAGEIETLNKTSKIYENGDLQIFRKPGTALNITNKEPNIGDWCIGFVEGEFINAEYLGPDKTLLTSFNI